jgi:hypothetical protein
VSKKRLSVVTAGDQKLGRSTIMDRALAQRYGAPYIHLAAFAIDLDRVCEHEGDHSTLPFGWEVWLLERYLEWMFEHPARDDLTSLVEETCLAVMELPRNPPGGASVLGSQLPFAVYYGVARGGVPNALGNCFHAWKKPPVDLLDDMKPLDQDAGLRVRLANHCIGLALQPALIPPVREALIRLAEG